MAKMARKKQHILATNPEYQGKYVVFGPSGSKDIIASNSKLDVVVAQARRQGVDAPAVVFIPKKGATCIY